MRKDPVESTRAYELAMQQIQPRLDREFPANQYVMGICHRYWHRKKELLQESGIAWQSPAELNPDIRFD